MRLRLGAWVTIVVAGLATGCADRSSVDAATDGPIGPVDDGDDGDPTADDGVGTDAGDDDGGPDGDDDGSTATDLPCDVAEIFAARCWSCHNDPPKFGAPMPLVAHDHVLRPLASDATQTVADGIGNRIVDAVKPMPPTGFLPDDELAIVQAWLDAGTPAGDTACDDLPPDPDEPDALPCEPTHTFVAHANGSADPYYVPVVDDLYMCFTFKSPFAAGMQGTAWGPIVDDERVLHHWILYKTATAQVDGGVGPCNMPGDATFLSGWAPGGTNFVMPEGVGLELASPSEWLILQVHYNNVAGHQDALDGSGVAMCTTPTPRPQAAGVVWLGTFDINIPAGANGHPETGTCPSLATSALPGPLNIISSFPHMHELGRAFRTEILRGSDNGPSEILVDVPQFSFSNQIGYPHDPPVVLNPGDALRTTCTYDNPGPGAVGFGEGTSDEMCFNFVLTYPINTVPVRECTF